MGVERKKPPQLPTPSLRTADAFLVLASLPPKNSEADNREWRSRERSTCLAWWVAMCISSCAIWNPTKEFFWKSTYLVTLEEIQDASAREVTRSHSSRILSFDLIGQHQNKRFHVTENRFAARVRRRYFSEGEKRRPEIHPQATHPQPCQDLAHRLQVLNNS